METCSQGANVVALPSGVPRGWPDPLFTELSLELFKIQAELNPVYRRFCSHRGVSPEKVEHWSQIPALPITAFKGLEVSLIAPEERAHFFLSSGTTVQTRSRHFHDAASLGVYETSLLEGFRVHLFPEPIPDRMSAISLTPPPAQAPHSSLVHMFATLSRELVPVSFFGKADPQGNWELDLPALHAQMEITVKEGTPCLLLGTAFSFVHWMDGMEATRRTFPLPPGSRLLETGGYKGRSRVIAKEDLHQQLSERLALSPRHIVSEYGMSELSSQAYDAVAGREAPRRFQFPPWCRFRCISPETGAEVREPATGLLQIFDLANTRSVMALQTEDLVQAGEEGFLLAGRASAAELRGCSLMTL